MQKNSLNSILSKKTDTSNPKVVLEVDGKFYEVGELKKINMLTVSIALGEEIKTESKESKSPIENEDGETDSEKLAESQTPEVPEELTPEQEEVKKELEEEIDSSEKPVDEEKEVEKTSSDKPSKKKKNANK